jgi:hypothetical protein
VEAERFILRSTRGVAQEFEFRVAPVAGGYCVKSEHRIDGCHTRRGPCMLTPLPLHSAVTWANAKAATLARSAAAFRVAKSVEDQIEELFFGTT